MDLLDCLPGIIPGGVSEEDFAAATKAGRADAARMLRALERAGIGRDAGDAFEFTEGDRLRAVMAALGQGAPVEEAAELIHWRDFEGLTAEILAENGFATMRNLMLKKPRMEIDVVGIRLGIALLIDCKHWRRTGAAALRKVVQKQIGRTKHYVASTGGAVAVPVLVTLHSEGIQMIDGAPVVPISAFQSFIDEFYGNLDSMRQVRAG
ncbi:conserved hypothetical protein [Cenarchaeum symbiosum A]|uniref:Restriction endonuclease type IV Mrr domain-containing protein n=1 Tax=Cenarchaeum symbiosum (strain A) TaxID=414004 RepID=A0RX68_CENSY|nr:conserved hypothetical protein [Cenarchaeum symbiosum A]